MKINNYFLHVIENSIHDSSMFHLQDNVHPTYMSLIKKSSSQQTKDGQSRLKSRTNTGGAAVPSNTPEILRQKMFPI